WQRDSGSIAFHDPANACGDFTQQVAQLEVRHHPVGQVKDQLQPFILTCQLRLRLVRSFKIQRTVDGDSELVRDQCEELDCLSRIGVGTRVAHPKDSDTAVHCGEREDARGANPELSEVLAHSRIPGFALPIRDDKWLLVLEHPRGRRFVWQKIRDGHFLVLPWRVEHTPLHRQCLAIDDVHQDIVEGDKPPQFAGETLTKSADVTITSDGRCRAEQVLVPAPGHVERGYSLRVSNHGSSLYSSRVEYCVID